MATKLPVVINNVRFWINPTNISSKKALNIANLDTMRGRQFQVWWPAPEVVTIQGEAFGSDAYSQLLYLKKHYEGTDGQPTISTLKYKTTKYKGYIVSLDVSADVKNLDVWTYSLNLQLLHGQKFNIEDFSLKPTGPTIGALENLEKVGEVLDLTLDSITDAIGRIRL